MTLKNKPWIVHKFGGTSLGTATRYRNAAAIVANPTGNRQAVVVSAMGGVTDALINLLGLAASDNPDLEVAFTALQTKVLGVAKELVSAERFKHLEIELQHQFQQLDILLKSCSYLHAATREVVALVSGQGEIWSAMTLNALLQEQGHNAQWLNARDVLVVRPKGKNTPDILVDRCQQNLDRWLTNSLQSATDIVVITGFIAADDHGVPATLGRNGSDYSAAIFSALLYSKQLTIWTDVDGVMSANPKLVPEAVVLDSMSYKEAMELAYFGAKVLHPSTLAPAIARDVVIYIRNSFDTTQPGTRICAEGSTRFAVKGFATIDNMALVNLEGTHMIGVPGISSRLFGALKESGVSVVMISQASSEHSICFVIPEEQADEARTALEKAFFVERQQGQIQTLNIESGCCILAVVGDQMAGQTGIAARFFDTLGDASINIKAIAQGSSERNISAVIASVDSHRALRAAHAGFYLSQQTLSIGIIGAGSVGGTLLDQLAAQAQQLKKSFNLDLRVRAISTSKQMLLSELEIDLTTWRQQMEQAVPFDMKVFQEHVNAEHLPHAVLVDCSASEGVASHYKNWMDNGIHVVTPNKKANTGSIEYYHSIRRQRVSGAQYLYETTVGAGLPIIQTLRDLIQTGDQVLSIEGIFSGTLSYLFNVYSGQSPFSDLVRDARKMGYTEPDPRDDLSGMDVARKVVILGREIGLPIGLEDVTVDSLVPNNLKDVSVEEYMNRLDESDATIEEHHHKATSEGKVLRFVGKIDHSGKASVALRFYPSDHPFARIQLTDNIVQFTTQRYAQNPLVVQGPGAGPAVTAGGVFGDLLRLAGHLGTAR